MYINTENIPTQDLIKAAKNIQAYENLQKQIEQTLRSVTTVNKIEKKDVEWLVPKWIPKGEITLLAGDGGIGKTSIWCRIVSEISQGRPCFLEDPFEEPREENRRCMFFSSEDNVSTRLKEHFENYNAFEHNMLTIERTIENEAILKRLKLGSPELKVLVMGFKPAICVFDPIQAYLPDGMNMNSRNGIRSCMEALSTLGKNIGTAFLLVCHTNKRENTSGRNRISNSADLWDAARSVIMTGPANLSARPELKYLSNEKNNYAPLQTTILYSSGEMGKIRVEGISYRHEAGFLKAAKKKDAPPSKLEDCKETILILLEDTEGGALHSAELDKALQSEGFSLATIKRAKLSLKETNKIRTFRKGYGSSIEFYTALK